MAVFRNVMAFLGLDEDDHVYDDETYYEDEDELPVPPQKPPLPPDRQEERG